MKAQNLDEIRAGMAVLDPDLEYYAITLTGSQNGELFVDTQTSFDGWGDPECRTEIRIPSLVRAEMFMDLWAHLGEGFLIVKNEVEWRVFYLLGGHGLVERTVAEENMPSMFRKEPSLYLPKLGFSSEKAVMSSALRRVPTPKLRGSIMKRDGRRCRICGRSPSNHLDLELHVHHIKPWEDRGATIKGNLITLCQTCHRGLDPLEDSNLFGLIPADKEDQPFADKVRRHREIVFIDLVAEMDKKPGRRKRGG